MTSTSKAQDITTDPQVTTFIKVGALELFPKRGSATYFREVGFQHHPKK